MTHRLSAGRDLLVCPVVNVPPPSSPYAPPQAPSPTGNPGDPPPILGGLIPRNRNALIAYYCGIFSIIPCLGVVLGPMALVFGILGLKTAAREPFRKGKVHAWVGIVCGGLVSLLSLAAIGFWVFVGLVHR